MTTEASRYFRDIHPSQYLFKIESFSILLEANLEKYESNEFEVGGYKWRLHLYPNGNKKRNVLDYISLYLVISDTENLPRAWEVNVQFKLFVFDYIRDKYLTVEDGGGVTRRFHGMETEWGFDQFLSLNTLKTSSNGYLLDDSCVFGAEVLVMKYGGKGECLSFIQEPQGNIYTWKIDNFSAMSEQNSLSSPEFSVGEQKWRISLYPKGTLEAKGKSLSLFLEISDYLKRPLNWKVYAKFKLRIVDRVSSKHQEKQASCWLSASSPNRGYRSFILLDDLHGYIVKNTLIVEAEIMTMSAIKYLT